MVRDFAPNPKFTFYFGICGVQSVIHAMTDGFNEARAWYDCTIDKSASKSALSATG